ncbi:MAG: hypothetical protein ACRDJE_04620 [Dehalococcoidia bacterium]
MQQRIEQLQPYNRTTPAQDDPLWLLSDLSNTDKHHVLHLAVWTLGGVATAFRGDLQVHFTPTYVNPVTDGAELGRWRVTGQSGVVVKTELHSSSHLLITIDDPGPAQGRDIVAALTTVEHDVRSIIAELAQLL